VNVPRIDDRSAAPLVGNLLLVAVAIIIAATLATVALTFLEDTGTPTADAAFEYEKTPVGLEMTPVAMGTDVFVQLNGKRVAELEADTAGQSVLLPTAPGDRITVVSTDERRSVLVNREIDSRDEIGDFVAYYPFENGNATTVVDESGNGNSGNINGGITRVNGSALDFNGSTGTYVDVGDLTVDGPDAVEEITVAIEYQIDSGSGIQNLIEHQDSSFAWYVETDGKHGDPHQMEFDIGFNSPPNSSITTGDIPAGETQILVGTFDGSEMAFYRNGNLVGSKPLDREVALGQVILGADSDPNSIGQNLDGQLHNVRLYYAAFDGEEVERITEVMGG
jgi:FlaG/FlaF family flagellin (archaellin)